MEITCPRCEELAFMDCDTCPRCHGEGVIQVDENGEQIGGD